MAAGLRRIPQQRSPRDLVCRILDAAAIVAGLNFAVALTGERLSEHAVTAAVAAIALQYLVGEATGMARSWRGIAADREIFGTLFTWLMVLPPMLTIGYLTGYGQFFPRALLLAWWSATALIALLARIFLRAAQHFLQARGYNARQFAIVGVNELGFTLARNIQSSPELGLKLVGFYDDRPAGRLPAIPADIGIQAGDLDQLVRQTREKEIRTIYITFPMRAEFRIKGILDRLSDTTASVYIVPDFFVFEMLHSRWTSIQGLPAVSVFENPFYGIDGLVKRAVDLLLATLVLALAALPMLLIAAAVKFTSRGPVFFRQKRYGLDGREILVWKFRTMRVCESGNEVKQATKGDPRVTPLGAVLRKASLDELPQLFNVLQGNMSLVGPRPHASLHNEAYRKLIHGYMLRHKVKPGITGLAQVNGLRGETDTLDKMERRVRYDHRYIREWSLWMDVKILFQTVWVVLSRQNAY